MDANQKWTGFKDGGNHPDSAITRSTCRTCGERAYWVGTDLVWPPQHLGPPPSEDMPPNLADIYKEARAVAAVSPRAAAALLRLLIEKLVINLDANGKPDDKLNARVRRLEEAHDITRRTVAALDAVRWGGNDAVHEGTIDPEGKDDESVVRLLFDVVNRIVEDTSGLDQRIAAFTEGRKAAKERARSENPSSTTTDP